MLMLWHKFQSSPHLLKTYEVETMKLTKGFIKYMIIIGAIAFVLDNILLYQAPVYFGALMFPLFWLADVAIQTLLRPLILKKSRPCPDCEALQGKLI